jgi:hypothetical protein
VLKKQVAELQQKSKDNEYIIRGKMQEKDEQMKVLTTRVNSMQSMLEKLIVGLNKTTDQQQLNTLAESMFASGILKSQNVPT